MAKVALRASWLVGTFSRLACLMVIAGLLLGFALMAGAQNPDQPKPKVVKPGDTPEPKVVKPDPKTTDPKTTDPKKTDPPKTVPVVPGDLPPGFSTAEEPTLLINEHFRGAWKENKIQPSERADDYTYIRRVYLDITGRIPTVPEIEAYMKDPANSRREKLLDRLLYDRDSKDNPNKGNPDYAANFATLWNHWLMTRTGPQLYRRQMHLWLEDYFTGATQSYKSMVEQLLTASGKTNENGAVNFILAHLGANNPAGQVGRDGQFDVVPITSRAVRLFLGYQIQCTQCHDHPFNADWKQKHFWGTNVFFRQVERIGQLPQQNNQQMQNAVLELRENRNANAKGLVFYEKRSGVFLPAEAEFMDLKDKGRIPKTSQLTRREELARFLTGHPNFNKAVVNRYWGHFFGRGLNVKPAADDFGEHNEVVHPELLAKLGEHFAGSGAHDLRKLIKWICSSEPYNLKAIANATNAPGESEPYFARVPVKMMSPEQLLESLITATKPAGGDDAGRDAQRNLRNQWMALLVRNFGDDEGNEMSYNGTILQALLMMNGRDINQAINSSGTAKEAQKRVGNPKQFVDYLFMAALSRPSNQREYTALMTKLQAGPRGDAAVQDLFWALLNCNEFILNH
jgi:hypothetical protein